MTLQPYQIYSLSDFYPNKTWIDRKTFKKTWTLCDRADDMIIWAMMANVDKKENVIAITLECIKPNIDFKDKITKQIFKLVEKWTINPTSISNKKLRTAYHTAYHTACTNWSTSNHSIALIAESAAIIANLNTSNTCTIIDASLSASVGIKIASKDKEKEHERMCNIIRTKLSFPWDEKIKNKNYY